MKEYIEKDAVLDLMNDLRNYKSLDFVDAIEVVEKQPAADVVEVVRCRDCDIGTCYSDDSVQCEWCNGFYADDFCPRGKRKGGGH